MQGARINLTLYIADHSAESLRILETLALLCEQHLPGRHFISTVDISKVPDRSNRRLLSQPIITTTLGGNGQMFDGDAAGLEKLEEALRKESASPHGGGGGPNP